jgi:hypothetical protein
MKEAVQGASGETDVTPSSGYEAVGCTDGGKDWGKCSPSHTRWPIAWYPTVSNPLVRGWAYLQFLKSAMPLLTFLGGFRHTLPTARKTAASLLASRSPLLLVDVCSSFRTCLKNPCSRTPAPD